MKFAGNDYKTYSIPTNNTAVLIIAANNGFLACGYIKVETANKVGDACAIVTGVKTPEDMLEAYVVDASEKAKEMGVKKGMNGTEALLLMS